MRDYLQPFSQAQYNSAWSKWISFLKSLRPPTMSHDVVMSFFRHLFEDCNFAPSTIATYKSALVHPLSTGFGIDLNTIDDSMLFRALNRRRPRPPPSHITWSLDKVLSHIANQSSSDASIRFILNTAIFLIAFASGARVSELAALTRDPACLSFNDDGTVKIRPHPTFIGKNELHDRRWGTLGHLPSAR